MYQITDKQKRYIVFLAAIALVALYLIHLNSYPLMDPDEGRYGEIPREMLATGNFITPHLNGVLYFEKPALQYWLTAFFMHIFGFSEGATRIVPAVSALLNIFLSAWMARLIFTGRTALLTAVILGTSVLSVVIGSINILDMLITMFITLSLASFYKAYKGQNRRYLLLFYAGMALGLLTKGLISIVLPLGVIFWYMVFTRQWNIVRFLLYWPGILLFFVLGVPWFYLVCKANPDFFYFFFIREHFLRFATKMMHRYKPFWFFMPIIFLGTFPWLGFLPSLFCRDGILRKKKSAQEKDGVIFLLCWFLVIFIFYSFSDSKLVPYIMPCMTPLAILLAANLRESDHKGRFIGYDLWLNCLGWFVFAAALVWYSLQAGYLDLTQLLARGGIAIFALVAGIPAALFTWHKTRRVRCTVAVLGIFSFAFAVGLQLIQEQVARERTSYYVSEQIAAIKEPGAAVVSYGDYIQGLPYYLKERVYVASYYGELLFGAEHLKKEDTWFIDGAQLQKMWQGKRQVFVVFDKNKRSVVEGLLPDCGALHKGGQYYFIVNHK